MGCVCSRGRRIDKDDAPSFTYYVNGGRSRDHDVDDADASAAGKAKSPETNSFLGKAGEKAVEVLDTLGSSVTNLSYGSDFVDKMASRGYKISILAFEVANTIVKGSSLLQSLSKDDILFLKKEILPSQGVQSLVSTDTSELLSLAANDKREELRVFSLEIARFGDLCKDPQWHNLTRYFQKLDSDVTPPEKLREAAEATMQQLIALAQRTSELYHEFHAMDRLRQDYKQRRQEEELLPVSQRGDGLVIMGNELKHQKKIVRNLKKRSLWCRNLEEIVEKLVEVVVFLHKEIGVAYEISDASAYLGTVDNASACKSKKLGDSGLSLHYANIINRIDNIVSRPISMPSNTRDVLYNELPTSVKASIRSRIQSFDTDKLTVSQIKVEMQKILQWIAPMAENTIKAHQGFGWVGEWANMCTEVNKKPTQNNELRILTLYHADKDKTDEYLLQLIVWLHHLVVLVNDRGSGSNLIKPASPSFQNGLMLSRGTGEDSASLVHDGKTPELKLSKEDRKLLEQLDCNRIFLGRSRSLGFGTNRTTADVHKRMLQNSWSSSDLLDFKVLS